MPAFSQPLMSLKIDDSYERLPIGFQLAVNPQTYSRIAAEICQGDADANLVRASPSFPLWVFISLGGLVFCLAHSSRHLCRPRRIRLSHGESCWHLADSCWGGSLTRSSFWWFANSLIYCLMGLSSFHHHFIILSTFYPCFVDCFRKTPERIRYLSRIIIMHISLWHTSARMNRDGKKELGAYRICREFLSIATHS